MNYPNSLHVGSLVLFCVSQRHSFLLEFVEIQICSIRIWKYFQFPVDSTVSTPITGCQVHCIVVRSANTKNTDTYANKHDQQNNSELIRDKGSLQTQIAQI